MFISQKTAARAVPYFDSFVTLPLPHRAPAQENSKLFRMARMAHSGSEVLFISLLPSISLIIYTMKA
jgi:hypothetical protein